MLALKIAVTAVSLALTLGHPNSQTHRSAPGQQRGTLIQAESLGVVDRATLARNIDFLAEKITVQNEVELYKIVYWTVDRGRAVKASGLLAAPRTRNHVKGVVAYLHGTNIPRATAPSMPDRVDGNEEAAIFAGNGYYAVLPDYLGLGVSSGPQSYLVLQPQVDATLDMLRAVRALARQRRWPWDPALFLMGFSQGGHTLAGVHRELEQRRVAGLSVVASVSVAGAFDLRDVTVPYALEQGGLEMLGFLAFVVSSYSTYYGHAIGDVLVEPYATNIPRLFDGSHPLNDIVAGLGSDARSMFQPVFLRELERRETNWFTRALDENSAYAWVPRAPMRLYFGEDDHNVSPADSRALQAYAEARGGAVTLHSLGSVGHQESLTRAYPPALRWFDSLVVARRSPPAAPQRNGTRRGPAEFTSVRSPEMHRASG